MRNSQVHPIFRDILNSFAMASELQAMADEIATRNAKPAPQLRTQPAAEGPRYYSTAYATCSLCGDPSDQQVCAGCDEGYRELGL